MAQISTVSPAAVGTGASVAKFQYRRDVDGLRAISVLPVVFYHFRIAPFSGGYVGVDVFFVISGYLITGLIFTEMVAGRFSVSHFYERRVRRILPALFLVLACSTAAALFLLFPRDLLRFAENLGATTFFISNIDFWKQSGYFDVRSDLKPLLHTWSLAVEEQFYLFFPPLLLALHSRKRTTLLAFVALLFLSSLALSIWTVRLYPSAAFYLAPQRTWELMLGAILALAGFPPPPRVWVRELLAWVGFALLGFAVFFFRADTPFPGEAALVPCAGAALLIYSGENADTWSSRLLSWSPLVFVGLVSYSLYLWHWPFLVFTQYASVDPLDRLTKAALIAASFGLAIVSWRYVERPFRGAKSKFSRRGVFLLTGVAMTCFACAAALIYALDGLPRRFAPPVRRILAEASDLTLERAQCVGRSETQSGKLCIIGDKSAASPSFLLWGDSHADSLLPAIERAASRAHRSGYFLAHLGCPPMLNVQVTNEPTLHCPRVNETAIEVLKTSRIHEVILAARWAMYDEGHGYGPDRGDHQRLIDNEASDPPGLPQHEIFRRALARTVTALRAMNVAVVIVASIPEVSAEVPERLALLALSGRHDPIGPTRAEFLSRQQFVEHDLAELASTPGLKVIEPASLLCPSGRCSVADGGVPLYRDSDHLSTLGARKLVSLFIPVF